MPKESNERKHDFLLIKENLNHQICDCQCQIALENQRLKYLKATERIIELEEEVFARIA